MAVPRDNRWHRKETALLGGVGIFSAIIIAWFSGALWAGWSTLGQPYLPMVLCASGIFLLGLADDIFNMDPQHKLAGQVIITAILLFFGFRLGWTDSKTLEPGFFPSSGLWASPMRLTFSTTWTAFHAV